MTTQVSASEMGAQIIGGGDATETYPFMVSLQSSDGSHSCGAALIDQRWAVTAAHCVTEENTNNTVDPSGYQLRIGATDRTSGGEVVTVDKFTTPAGWDWNKSGNDIAIIHLTSAATATPVAIGAKPGPGMAVRLIGWGQTCPTQGCGELPTTLQELDTKIAPESDCADNFDGPVELCVDSKSGTTGSCYGDSGGPAIVKADGRWTLAGVTSRGQTDKCADKASIYTSTTAYRAWIANNTKSAA